MLQLSQVPGVTVPSAGSTSPTAARRLQKDYAKLMQDPVDGMLALPNEDNILEWHYCFCGSPVITKITQNGRFTTNTRLCLSIFDYRPELRIPGWTDSAKLICLHSFMN